ncbi:MAG: hypothetical protein M3032_05690 [Verrucomicrobiota bacterium]|nr:hypothetical protein [Verrucomicrobiota bacterium]
MSEIEIHRISDEIAVAKTYDPQVKADLFSTALTAAAGVFLIDPFAIDSESIAVLTNGRNPFGVIVTNENHVRASREIADRFSIATYASREAAVPESKDLDTLPSDLTAIPIAGAPVGEIALHSRTARGVLIIGDAVINFGSHGFELLPAKYCTHPKLMRKALRQLLALEFQQMFFAHGTPILANARERLATLLDER